MLFCVVALIIYVFLFEHIYTSVPICVAVWFLKLQTKRPKSHFIFDQIHYDHLTVLGMGPYMDPFIYLFNPVLYLICLYCATSVVFIIYCPCFPCHMYHVIVFLYCSAAYSFNLCPQWISLRGQYSTSYLILSVFLVGWLTDNELLQKSFGTKWNNLQQTHAGFD